MLKRRQFRAGQCRTCDWSVDVKLTLNEMKSSKWVVNKKSVCLEVECRCRLVIHGCLILLISKGQCKPMPIIIKQEEGLSFNALNVISSFEENNTFWSISFYICQLGSFIQVNILILFIGLLTIFWCCKQRKQNIRFYRCVKDWTLDFTCL